MMAIGIEGSMEVLSVLLAVCMLVMHVRISKQHPLNMIGFFEIHNLQT
jgi:hypothetical protein